MEQEDWVTRIGTSIAREIRRHRLAAGMSAQQLSDACGKLGAPIPRTVISNIENGRRTNVSVAEVIVLARALRIPPIAFIFPAGYEAEVEYLPGRRIDTIRAINWFSGVTQIDERSTLDVMPRDEWALTISREHRSLEHRISRIYKDIFEDDISHENDFSGPEGDAARERANMLSLELKALREEMVRRGLKLPKTYLKVDDLPVPENSSKEGEGYWMYKGQFPPF
ncbi:helix-turn-helix domain-containing protein [Streptomyces sp. NPDC088747]|uniref:helix-turn-helix domain-containing protein n=1 Tax=Streptomyces sp. NPDC088747 TaxID=3365886 RepID=UPI0038075340